MTTQHHFHVMRGARHHGAAIRTKQAHATRLMAVADRLFEEFDELPVLAVIRAMIDARRELTGRPDGMANPDDVHRVARAGLLAATLDAERSNGHAA